MPSFRKLQTLWMMLAVVTLTITLAVYLVVVPTVQGKPTHLQGLEANLGNRLENLEAHLRSDTLGSDRLGSGALADMPLTESGVSGGRARGGSFSRSPSYSSPSRSPSYSSPSRSPSYDYGYGSSRRSSGPVIVPYPTYGPAPVYVGSPGDGAGSLIVVLIVLGFFVLPIALNYFRRRNGEATGSPQGELMNDRVTVTRLQVALLAQARELQKDLNQLALQAHLETSQGLTEFLRETVLALLRHPDYWTHVRASSETVSSRERAGEIFERLSIEERSKFAAETLVNVAGQVRQQTPYQPSGEVASHIVVTLLLGTAHDHPLFGAIHSTADLKTALQRLGAVSPDYLLIYELLWTPQDETDSLSSDELIASYPDLIRL